MPRHPKVNENDLSIIVSYLKNPKVETEIHAEIPHQLQGKFEREYFECTKINVPNVTNKEPYYVLPKTSDKRGRELRIYFIPIEPIPLQINKQMSKSTWYGTKNKKRINHTNLVMQLFECGFILGLQDYKRI